MNASDTGQEAEDRISPEAADRVQQDHQVTDQPPRTETPRAETPLADQASPNGPTDGAPRDSQPSGSQYQPRYDYAAGDQPLYRPLNGRMVAGVAAGIAQYLGVDVTVVRIVLAVLTVVGGAGIPVYLAGWLLIPDEGAGQSIASELIGSLQGRSS